MWMNKLCTCSPLLFISSYLISALYCRVACWGVGGSLWLNTEVEYWEMRSGRFPRTTHAEIGDFNSKETVSLSTNVKNQNRIVSHVCKHFKNVLLFAFEINNNKNRANAKWQTETMFAHCLFLVECSWSMGAVWKCVYINSESRMLQVFFQVY